MVAPNNEQVEYNIIIKAAQAMADLKELSTHAGTFKQKTDMAAAAMLKFSAASGMSLKSVKSVFKEIDSIMSDTVGGSAMFGKLGKQGWDEAAMGAENFGKKAKSGFESAIAGVNAWRIALGAVISMLLFQGIQAITQFFSQAIDQAKQFEATLYRLRNAERQLSMEGIEVSMKGLKKGIEDIQKALPIFSKEDVSELVGSVAVTTKELGYTGDEILKLGAAIAILNINSSETESLLQTQAKVTNSLISPQAKSIGNLGLAFGKANIEAMAFKLGLLEVGETINDLTEKEKSKIKYEIVLETAGIAGVDDLEKLRDVIKEAGGDFAALDEYLQSNAAKIDANTAAWKDLQTTVGQVILPFIPVLTDFFKLIRDGFNGGKVIIIEFMSLVGALGLVMAKVFTGQISNIEQFNATIKQGIETFRETLVNDFFKEMPSDAPEWFKAGWGSLIKEEAETATGPLQELGEAVEEIDLSEFEQKIEDIMEDTANAREDLEQSLARKLEDLEEEYRRKAVDAQVDYLRKIEDINLDFENKSAKLKQKHREEDERDEEKYQLALWELRMRFLMNLDDALHARDARQVLRLQKEYKLDKEALRRKHELEEKEREQGQKAELENLEQQRQERLAEARLEYERKLADLNIAKQREQEDLQKWYEREQADIEEAQRRKLESLIKGWMDEQKITEENAAAVYAILVKYFGPGGLSDQLYQYMVGSMLSTTAAAVGSLNSLLGLANGINPFTSGAMLPAPEGSLNNNQGIGQGENPFTDSGLLPTTPKMDIPDMAEVAALSRINRNVGRVSANGAGGGGMNGQVRILVDLSPDLEGRIVEQSMDGVADIITRVGRTK